MRLGMWVAPILFSLSATLAGAGDGGEFRIQKDVIDKIYRETVTEAGVDPSFQRSSVGITPGISIASLSSLTLSNNYFDVPYARSVGALPLLHLGLAVPLRSFGEAILYGVGSLGYTYREGVYLALSKDGDQYRDLLKLHALPLLGSLRLEYRIPGLPALKPTFALGGGAYWFYQSGKLDGIEQGFWIPVVLAAPGVRLFDGEEGGSWFGGINAAVSWQNSFASSQSLRALAFDLGATLLF